MALVKLEEASDLKICSLVLKLYKTTKEVLPKNSLSIFSETSVFGQETISMFKMASGIFYILDRLT